jgi:excisionase family DNA binding protein
VTTTAHAIPHPDEKPTLDLWPETGVALGLGRSSTYEAAARGEIPTIRIGRCIRVPTAALRRMLQLDGPDAA